MMYTPPRWPNGQEPQGQMMINQYQSVNLRAPKSQTWTATCYVCCLGNPLKYRSGYIISYFKHLKRLASIWGWFPQIIPNPNPWGHYNLPFYAHQRPSLNLMGGGGSQEGMTGDKKTSFSNAPCSSCQLKFNAATGSCFHWRTCVLHSYPHDSPISSHYPTILG